MMKTVSVSSLLLCVLLLMISVSQRTSAAVGRKGALVGGWTPIKDLKDPHVEEVAKFAVSEHNKLAKPRLLYDHVVRGETQVVAGINYRLIITAAVGGDKSDYEAIVWEKSWENFMNLTSFKKV